MYLTKHDKYLVLNFSPKYLNVHDTSIISQPSSGSTQPYLSTSPT